MALISYITPTQPTRATGGIVPYRHGGSIAMRSRCLPKRVTSARHTATVNIISQLSIFWESPVSNAQRAAWGNYAFGTPLFDAWGAPRYIRGYAHYMRSNRPRLQFSLPRIDTAPSTVGFPTFTLYGFGLDPGSTTASLYFEPGDGWSTTNGAYVLVWIGYPTRTTRNTPTEIYTPLATIAGSASSPPPNPVPLSIPTPLHATKARIWLRASLTLPDGRLSV